MKEKSPKDHSPDFDSTEKYRILLKSMAIGVLAQAAHKQLSDQIGPIVNFSTLNSVACYQPSDSLQDGSLNSRYLQYPLKKNLQALRPTKTDILFWKLPQKQEAIDQFQSEILEVLGVRPGEHSYEYLVDFCLLNRDAPQISRYAEFFLSLNPITDCLPSLIQDYTIHQEFLRSIATAQMQKTLYQQLKNTLAGKSLKERRGVLGAFHKFIQQKSERKQPLYQLASAFLKAESIKLQIIAFENSSQFGNLKHADSYINAILNSDNSLLKVFSNGIRLQEMIQLSGQQFYSRDKTIAIILEKVLQNYLLERLNLGPPLKPRELTHIDQKMLKWIKYCKREDLFKIELLRIYLQFLDLYGPKSIGDHAYSQWRQEHIFTKEDSILDVAPLLKH